MEKEVWRGGGTPYPDKTRQVMPHLPSLYPARKTNKVCWREGGAPIMPCGIRAGLWQAGCGHRCRGVPLVSTLGKKISG